MDRDHARIVLCAAETAADGRRPHPHVVRRQIEGVAERLVDVVGALHRPDDGQATLLEPGGHRLALDVDVLLVSGTVDALETEVRGRQLPLDAVAAQRQLAQWIAPGGLRVELGVELLVADLDGSLRQPRLPSRRRRDERHRLADVPHPVGGQCRPHVVDEADGVAAREVLGEGDQRALRGPLRMPGARDDARVRVRAPHRGTVEHPGSTKSSP